MSRTAWKSRGLYAITDAQLLPGERLFEAVEAAILGGAVLVQYRDKQGTTEERLSRAQRLQAICQRLGCPLLINDDLELALQVGAAGVHLGRTDGSLLEARRRLGPDAIIGATCHASLEFAREAQAQEASYVAFGSFFPSPTKPSAQPAPLDLLTEARRTLDLPIVAIGGITLDNAASVIAAGADLLAVINGLFDCADVRQRAAQFASLFT